MTTSAFLKKMLNHENIYLMTGVDLFRTFSDGYQKISFLICKLIKFSIFLKITL